MQLLLIGLCGFALGACVSRFQWWMVFATVASVPIAAMGIWLIPHSHPGNVLLKTLIVIIGIEVGYLMTAYWRHAHELKPRD